tara:strand:- start:264 stop:803 length:540 start_codon:yes stop_codon:yes gene_type:complete
MKYAIDVLRILKQKGKKGILYKFNLFLIITIILIAIDLITKKIAIDSLNFAETIETFIPIIDFLLIYNSGIAFGIFDNEGGLASTILLIITVLISIYLIWLLINETFFLKKIALSFILGGALGNIIDRAGDGTVTDFLHLTVFQKSFFIFNLADAFITFGAILIIYFELVNFFKNEESN